MLSYLVPVSSRKRKNGLTKTLFVPCWTHASKESLIDGSTGSYLDKRLEWELCKHKSIKIQGMWFTKNKSSGNIKKETPGNLIEDKNSKKNNLLSLTQKANINSYYLVLSFENNNFNQIAAHVGPNPIWFTKEVCDIESQTIFTTPSQLTVSNIKKKFTYCHWPFIIYLIALSNLLPYIILFTHTTNIIDIQIYKSDCLKFSFMTINKSRIPSLNLTTIPFYVDNNNKK